MLCALLKIAANHRQQNSRGYLSGLRIVRNLSSTITTRSNRRRRRRRPLIRRTQRDRQLLQARRKPDRTLPSVPGSDPGRKKTRSLPDQRRVTKRDEMNHVQPEMNKHRRFRISARKERYRSRRKRGIRLSSGQGITATPTPRNLPNLAGNGSGTRCTCSQVPPPGSSAGA